MSLGNLFSPGEANLREVDRAKRLAIAKEMQARSSGRAASPLEVIGGAIGGFLTGGPAGLVTGATQQALSRKELGSSESLLGAGLSGAGVGSVTKATDLGGLLSGQLTPENLQQGAVLGSTITGDVSPFQGMSAIANMFTQQEVAKAKSKKAQLEERNLQARTAKTELEVAEKAKEIRQEPVEAQNRAKEIMANNERIMTDVDLLLSKDLSKGVGGVTAAAAGFIPGTEARDIRGDIQTLTANQAFQTLQKMRDASKTGGALGQVSERELALLEAAVANLDPNLSVDKFTTNLQKFRNELERVNKSLSTEVLGTEKYSFGKTTKYFSPVGKTEQEGGVQIGKFKVRKKK
jgi:hypothetical protein